MIILKIIPSHHRWRGNTCLLARLSSTCLSFIHTRNKARVKLCRFVFQSAVHLASSTLLYPLYPCARPQRKSFPACLCFFDSEVACKHYFTLFKLSHRIFWLLPLPVSTFQHQQPASSTNNHANSSLLELRRNCDLGPKRFFPSFLNRSIVLEWLTNGTSSILRFIAKPSNRWRRLSALRVKF